MAEAEPESKVPVLTDVVTDLPRPRSAMDAQALEALSREVERTVLARLMPEVKRVIDQRLGEVVESLRVDLSASVTRIVREAVAAAVKRAQARHDSK
jgi:hypothetical protein